MESYRWLRFGDAEAQTVLFGVDEGQDLLRNLQRAVAVAFDRGIIPRRYELDAGRFNVEDDGRPVHAVSDLNRPADVPLVLRTPETPLRLRVVLASEQDEAAELLVEVDPSKPLLEAFMQARLTETGEVLGDRLKEVHWYSWHWEPIAEESRYRFRSKNSHWWNRSLSPTRTPWEQGLASSRPTVVIKPIIWWEWPPIWWRWPPTLLRYPPPLTGFAIQLFALLLIFAAIAVGTRDRRRLVVFHAHHVGGYEVDGVYRELVSTEKWFARQDTLGCGQHHVRALLKALPIRQGTLACSQWGLGRVYCDLDKLDSAAPADVPDPIETTFYVRSGNISGGVGGGNEAFQLFINRQAEGHSETAGELHSVTKRLPRGTYELGVRHGRAANPSESSTPYDSLRAGGGTLMTLRTEVGRDTSAVSVTLPQAPGGSEVKAAVELYLGGGHP